MEWVGRASIIIGVPLMQWVRSYSPTVKQLGFIANAVVFYVTISITGFTITGGIRQMLMHDMNYISLRVNWGQFDRGVRLSRYSNSVRSNSIEFTSHIM